MTDLNNSNSSITQHNLFAGFLRLRVIQLLLNIHMNLNLDESRFFFRLNREYFIAKCGQNSIPRTKFDNKNNISMCIRTQDWQKPLRVSFRLIFVQIQLEYLEYLISDEFRSCMAYGYNCVRYADSRTDSRGGHYRRVRNNRRGF